MGAKVTGVKEVQRYLMKEAGKLNEVFLDELNRLAMKVVTEIRTGAVSDWNDDTGNLRSSIGYIIMQDGEKKFSNFSVQNGKGQEGMEKAKSFAEELASGYPSGIVLIIVAGMEYASYVEAIESKNVLAGGELLARDLLRELKQKWDRKFGK